jgi:hypothetical protein
MKTLVRLYPRTSVIHTCYHSPRQAMKPMQDEKFSRFMEETRRMYVYILMLDAMQVLTYARYLKDILNQK